MKRGIVLRIPMWTIVLALAMVLALALAVSYQGQRAGSGSPAEAGGLRSWAENGSYSTTCPEKDNINIPLFASAPLEHFRVIATHPQYPLGPEDYPCPPIWEGCQAGDPAADDICHKLWDDGINVVEVCTTPEWWRPYAMRVQVGDRTAEASYLRFYRKIADEQSWPQVLVLYQDGNLRLKPHPPQGMADVCFGSSVIVGPAAPAERPYVDIEEVHIQPAEGLFEVDYREGGKAHLRLTVDRTQATVDVDVDYHTDERMPFATFRSMWVRDGMADVDHVRTAEGDFPIKGDWTRLEGPWWSFHRTVKSEHNPSAPDIRIELAEPEAGAEAEHDRLLTATYKGFEAMVDKATGLPYDRIDVRTLEPVARSVSATEMGLRILELIGARDLGLISPERANESMEQVLSTLEGLERVQVEREVDGQPISGRFFYGFYEFRDSHLVGKPGLSFLDNGNLAVALAIATQAFKGSNGDIAERARALLEEMDFRLFLRPDGAFSLSYDPETGRLGDRLGQWGSEGVLTVSLAVFKDGVAPSKLSELLAESPAQECTTADGERIRTIPGYAGGLWVKLFPLLFWGIERLPPVMLEDARRYVRCQIETARKQELPIWGWSPASIIDITATEDYREFGVKEIAQYYNSENYGGTELVAPYATFLVLGALGGWEPAVGEVEAALANLEAIANLNSDAYNDERGFVDVIDPRTGQLGPHLLSLDKGMEFLSLYNFLMRRSDQQGIERYLWAYLQELGKADEAQQVLDSLDKQMAKMIGGL